MTGDDKDSSSEFDDIGTDISLEWARPQSPQANLEKVGWFSLGSASKTVPVATTTPATECRLCSRVGNCLG